MSSNLKIYGEHDDKTISQMHDCMKVGNAVQGVLCADGHLGYAQPVGGVVAYEGQVSISGVGYDIGCGNLAVKLDTPYGAIKDRVGQIVQDIANNISFGLGRVNEEKVEHPIFDSRADWRISGMEDFKDRARAQLGTVGGGNHYVDLFVERPGPDEAEEAMPLWIGVHFGSRGFGWNTAQRYLKLAGGRDGMNVPPTVVDVESELGQRYLAGMRLAGEYAYAGRTWVANKVRKIIGGKILDSVHNHHNYAWLEEHEGRWLWVVRKGATPAFPGQRGFVGGSMGDDAVIVRGLDTPEAKEALYSTIHGAGRVFGRKEAKRRFTHGEMEEWLKAKGVHLIGGDLDESPMAYRRLFEVLDHHKGTIEIEHVLKPIGVVMAGANVFDPFKD